MRGSTQWLSLAQRIIQIKLPKSSPKIGNRWRISRCHFVAIHDDRNRAFLCCLFLFWLHHSTVRHTHTHTNTAQNSNRNNNKQNDRLKNSILVLRLLSGITFRRVVWIQPPPLMVVPFHMVESCARDSNSTTKIKIKLRIAGKKHTSYLPINSIVFSLFSLSRNLYDPTKLAIFVFCAIVSKLSAGCWNVGTCVFSAGFQTRVSLASKGAHRRIDGQIYPMRKKRWVQRIRSFAKTKNETSLISQWDTSYALCTFFVQCGLISKGVKAGFGMQLVLIAIWRAGGVAMWCQRWEETCIYQNGETLSRTEFFLLKIRIFTVLTAQSYNHIFLLQVESSDILFVFCKCRDGMKRRPGMYIIRAQVVNVTWIRSACICPIFWFTCSGSVYILQRGEGSGLFARQEVGWGVWHRKIISGTDHSLTESFVYIFFQGWLEQNACVMWGSCLGFNKALIANKRKAG